MKQLSFILLSLVLFFAACTKKTNTENGGSNLPISRSGEGEVLIVMDSTKWATEIGNAIRQTFSSDIPGLPQPESYFSLKYIKPAAFKSILRQASNVIIVMTLDNTSREGEMLRNYFTQESLQKISNDNELFMFTQNNVFARGQNVLYLFGQNDDQLVENIQENKISLRQYFLKNEKNRISRKVYSGKPSESINKRLLKEHQFHLNIPANYDLAKEGDNFVWIRQLGPDDKNIIVYYEPYESEKVFEESAILALRERIASANVVDVEKPSIYMTTETQIPLYFERINMNGKYTIEARGLWKLSDSSRGGPFIGYIFVDEELNRLYYVEGFLSNPGRNKREPMRELEIILSSFKTQSEM